MMFDVGIPCVKNTCHQKNMWAAVTDLLVTRLVAWLSGIRTFESLAQNKYVAIGVGLSRFSSLIQKVLQS